MSGAIELRHLRVLLAIAQTGSVSKAAESLDLGQPAVSIALARLREHYADPLFVRTAHGMTATALTQALLPDVQLALAAVERTASHRQVFEPHSAQREFRLAMTDISQLVLLPALLERLRQAATAAGLSPDAFSIM